MTEIIFEKTVQDEESEFPSTDSTPAPPCTDKTHADTDNEITDIPTSKLQAQTQTKSAFRHPATKNYAATDIGKKKTTRFSVTHQPSANKNNAALDSRNPFYFLPITEMAHKMHSIIDIDDKETSSTACDASRLNQDLDIVRIPTPFRFDRHPSPFTFASETFEPLFSHFSTTDSAYDCLSTTTGLTNFVDAMSSDHPDPYRLDTPFVHQPTDSTLDPIHHVPFLQHHPDLDSRMNPHAALLYYADATVYDNIQSTCATYPHVLTLA